LTAWRRRMASAPASAVRRRPAGTGVVDGSSLGLNIGLIVGIAAGVVVLFLVLGYAVNRYRRCRGGADCGSYRLDSTQCHRHLRYSWYVFSTQSRQRHNVSSPLIGGTGLCPVSTHSWYVFLPTLRGVLMHRFHSGIVRRYTLSPGICVMSLPQRRNAPSPLCGCASPWAFSTYS